MNTKQKVAIALAYIIIMLILCIIALPIIASINLFNFMVLSVCEAVFAYLNLRLIYMALKRSEKTAK